MAGRTVDLAFKADISQLTAQLKTLPGMTATEAKKMASSLEREIKKAERASTKAAKATAASWKKQRSAMEGLGKQADQSAQQLKGLEHAGGETSSIMGGVASAMDLVSPSAGAATRAIGDMAGGFEMVTRAGVGLAGPLAALSVAAVIGAKVWSNFADKQKKVQEELEETKRKKLELAAVTNDLDADLIAQRHKQLLAEGQITKLELQEYEIRNQAELKAGKQLTELQAKRDQVQKQYKDALQEQTRLQGIVSGGVTQYSHELEKQNKVVTELAEAEGKASAEYVNLRSAVNQYGDAMEASLAKEHAAIAARKISSGSSKEAETELQKLHRTTAALLPKKDLTKFEELSNQLLILQAASDASTKAQESLAPAIKQVQAALSDIGAQEAADDLEALVDEVDRLTGRATQSKMEELADLQLKIAEAIDETGDSTGKLKAAQADVSSSMASEMDASIAAMNKSVEELEAGIKKSAEASKQAWVSSFQAINSAASMIGAEILSRVEERADDEVSIHRDKVDDLQGQLDAARDEQAQQNKKEVELTEAQEKAKTAATVQRLQAELNAETAAADAVAEKQNEAVLKAFRATQALKISEIAMNTAAAIMAVTATGPAGMTLIGAIAALGATQAGIVASQEPPSFHLGGIVGSRPDERQITARAGEGVLTRQGVQAVGGAAGVAAANRGQGGGQALIVQHVYKHKVLDQVLSDSVARGGPIGGAINRRNPRGRKNPHGRRAS